MTEEEKIEQYKKSMELFELQHARVARALHEITEVLEQNSQNPCLPPIMLDSLEETQTTLATCSRCMKSAIKQTKKMLDTGSFNAIRKLANESIVNILKKGDKREVTELLKILGME